MVTFAEARALAEARVAPEYPAEADFAAATVGWENDTDYQVDVNSYQLLHGKYRDGTPLDPGDISRFAYVGTPCVTVSKSTGEVTLAYPGGRPFIIPDAVEVRDE